MTRANKYLLILAGWTLYGFLMGINAHWVAGLKGRPVSWPYAFVGEFGYALVWFCVTPAVLWLGRVLPFSRRNFWWAGPVHLGAVIVTGVLSDAAWQIGVRGLVQGIQPTLNVRTVMDSLDYAFTNYALIHVAQVIVDYATRFQAEQARSAELEAQLASAQLAALKMQLHPHFLFNTLHTISELIHESPDTAERMIARLSEFLRLTIDSSGTAEIPLRSEIDFLARYLEIEKLRYEDRLDVEFRIDPGLADAQVPNLLLQPLVENALRHGLGNKLHGGRIEIEAHRRQEQLQLVVADNGAGLDLSAPRRGVGLGNTEERLRRLYNGHHSMALRNRAGGGLEVTIQIPFRLTSTNGGTNGGVHGADTNLDRG